MVRQWIPEVCVFKGCQLDGWYCSNASGHLIRRKQAASVESLVEVFCTVAVESGKEVGDQTPVAILRRPSTMVDVNNGKAIDVPEARILTTKALRELVDGVQRGVAEADVWSIQTLVEPADGLRVVSIYNCDAEGGEKSDVFARPFSKAYSFPAEKPIIPSAEDLVADGCLEVPADRRAVVEAKTLNMVRFASRYNSLEFEGLVLEFVFTNADKPMLHGCWCSTLVPKEARKRLGRGASFNNAAEKEAPDGSNPGVAPEEGSYLLTHLLSEQVTRQARASRLNLVTKLARQLDQYHEIQTGWEQEVNNAKAALRQGSQELENCGKELVQLRSDMDALTAEHEERLVAFCREMYTDIEERSSRTGDDEAALEQARRRIMELNRLAGQLTEHGESLQESLDETVHKFDDISTSYVALQRELRIQTSNRRQAGRHHPDLEATLLRAQSLSQEVDREAHDIQRLNLRLERLHGELMGERRHAAQFEHFVRRIATGPAARMRTGGGFARDCMAKREAAVLVKGLALA